eukprot:TRINITY_DN19721_c0_g1_i1.p1 TRINITY_DN19721_c0_g1~~TRINITY_DN19721_c0_g1_i1.p1  ORF type:complete len:1599 (-),score=198.29 TRINITY_DN19721_c0_g1_i1:132-4574(-)
MAEALMDLEQLLAKKSGPGFGSTGFEANVAILAQELVSVAADSVSSQSGENGVVSVLKHLVASAVSAPVSAWSFPLVLAEEALAGLPPSCEAKGWLWHSDEGEWLLRAAVSRLALRDGTSIAGKSGRSSVETGVVIETTHHLERDAAEHDANKECDWRKQPLMRDTCDDGSCAKGLHSAVAVLACAAEYRPDLAVSHLRAAASDMASTFGIAQPGSTTAIGLLGLYNMCALEGQQLLHAVLPPDNDGLCCLGEGIRSHMMLFDTVVQHSAIDLLVAIKHCLSAVMKTYVQRIGIAEWILEMCRTTNDPYIRSRGAGLVSSLVAENCFGGEHGMRTVSLVLEVTVNCMGRAASEGTSCCLTFIHAALSLLGNEQQPGSCDLASSVSIKAEHLVLLLQGSVMPSPPCESDLVLPASSAPNRALLRAVFQLVGRLMDARMVLWGLSAIKAVSNALQHVFDHVRHVVHIVDGEYLSLACGLVLGLCGTLWNIGVTSASSDATSQWWSVAAKLLGTTASLARLCEGMNSGVDGAHTDCALFLASELLWKTIDPPRAVALVDGPAHPALASWLLLVDVMVPCVGSFFERSIADASNESDQSEAVRRGEVLGSLLLPLLQQTPAIRGDTHSKDLIAYRDGLLFPVSALREAAGLLLIDGVLVSALRSDPDTSSSLALMAASLMVSSTTTHGPQAALARRLVGVAMCNVDTTSEIGSMPPRAVFFVSTVCSQISDTEWIEFSDGGDLERRAFARDYLRRVLLLGLDRGVSQAEWLAWSLPWQHSVDAPSTSSWRPHQTIGPGLCWLLQEDSIDIGPVHTTTPVLRMPTRTLTVPSDVVARLPSANRLFVAVACMGVLNFEPSGSEPRSTVESREGGVLCSQFRNFKQAFLLTYVPSSSRAVELAVDAIPAASLEGLLALFVFTWELICHDQSALALLAYRRVMSVIVQRVQLLKAAIEGHGDLGCNANPSSIWNACMRFGAALTVVLDGSCARDIIHLVEIGSDAFVFPEFRPGSAHLLSALTWLLLKGDISPSEKVLFMSSCLRDTISAGISVGNLAPTGRNDAGTDVGFIQSEGQRLDQEVAEAACVAISAALLTEQACRGDNTRHQPRNDTVMSGSTSCGSRDLCRMLEEASCETWIAALMRSRPPRERTSASLTLATWYLTDPESAARTLPTSRLAELLMSVVANIGDGDKTLSCASCLLMVVLLSVSEYALRTRIFLVNTLTCQRIAIQNIVRAHSEGLKPPETRTAIRAAHLIYFQFLAKSRPAWLDPAQLLLSVTSTVSANTDSGTAGPHKLALLRAAEAILAFTEDDIRHPCPQTRIGRNISDGDAMVSESNLIIAQDQVDNACSNCGSELGACSAENLRFNSPCCRLSASRRARRVLSAFVVDVVQWRTAYAEAASALTTGSMLDASKLLSVDASTNTNHEGSAFSPYSSAFPVQISYRSLSSIADCLIGRLCLTLVGASSSGEQAPRAPKRSRPSFSS